VTKNKLSLYLFILAILVVATPILFESIGFKTYKFLRFVGIRNCPAYYFIFFSSFLLWISAGLLFPFKEEEGWICKCGYDLSFLNKKSKRCPECGKTLQLEWSSSIGQYSRKTLRRLYAMILLFVLGFGMTILGLLIKVLEDGAQC
jgi:hypothetical protein